MGNMGRVKIFFTIVFIYVSVVSGKSQSEPDAEQLGRLLQLEYSRVKDSLSIVYPQCEINDWGASKKEKEKFDGSHRSRVLFRTYSDCYHLASVDTGYLAKNVFPVEEGDVKNRFVIDEYILWKGDTLLYDNRKMVLTDPPLAFLSGMRLWRDEIYTLSGISHSFSAYWEIEGNRLYLCDISLGNKKIKKKRFRKIVFNMAADLASCKQEKKRVPAVWMNGLLRAVADIKSTDGHKEEFHFYLREGRILKAIRYRHEYKKYDYPDALADYLSQSLNWDSVQTCPQAVLLDIRHRYRRRDGSCHWETDMWSHKGWIYTEKDTVRAVWADMVFADSYLKEKLCEAVMSIPGDEFGAYFSKRNQVDGDICWLLYVYPHRKKIMVKPDKWGGEL